MKKTVSNYVLLLLFAFMLPSMVYAQKPADVIRVEGDQLIIRLDKRTGEEFKNLLMYFNLNEDSLFNYSNIGSLAKDGWILINLDKNIAEIAKPLNADAQHFDWGNQPIYFADSNPPGEPGYPAPVTYGVNKFKKETTVFESNSGRTLFYLPDHKNAKSVDLCGNFNRWNPSDIAMQKTDSGWVTSIDLQAGKYFYKFIVDGNWQHDQYNELKEKDGYAGFNSTYFKCNHLFQLQGNSNKKNVYVTGSFNHWNEKELKLQRTNSGWQLPVYLAEGTFTYKFIVDGDWILDPENKNVRSDGMNNFNSVISLGTATDFILKGYTSANSVILTGSFNNWNTGELLMEKTATGWKLPYVLAPGNYTYKYIIDGNWTIDPDNPFRVGNPEERNSVKTVDPNYTFILNAFPDAKEVLLSGNFNAWAEPGYHMIKSDAGWIFPVHLERGKQLYKFVVDGKWIVDPGNPLYEENEFGTGNSVLWIE